MISREVCVGRFELEWVDRGIREISFICRRFLWGLVFRGLDALGFL